MSDPDPTPAEEQVRRLLADARHDEPMPPEIADRLGEVLADLRGESRRTPAPGGAPPIDLADRRRRRIARNALIAAAAVVVLGVGVSQVDLSGRGEDGGSADSGSASAARESAPDDAGGDRLLPSGRPIVLSSEGFEREIRRLRPLDDPAGAAEFPQELLDDDDGDQAGRGWCDSAAWGSGRRILVRYDGERGVLVLRPPAGGARVADLYLCGETVPARTATIPAG